MNQGIEKVVFHIKEYLREDLNVEQLAKLAGYSVFHFSRIFKEIMGESVMSYVKRLRLEKASIELLYGVKNILEIALDAGFKTPTGFLKAFKKSYGVTPTKYKQLHTLR